VGNSTEEGEISPLLLSRRKAKPPRKKEPRGKGASKHKKKKKSRLDNGRVESIKKGGGKLPRSA